MDVKYRDGDEFKELLTEAEWDEHLAQVQRDLRWAHRANVMFNCCAFIVGAIALGTFVGMLILRAVR